MGAGRCFGVGVGPGDPELLTLKAARLLDECAAIAYFRAVKRESNARRIVAQHLDRGQIELPLVYPVTTEAVAPDLYETLLVDFYDESAKRVAEVLDDGCDVAVLCEGDPFFFGSYMYLHHRLSSRYEVQVVPGVSSAVAGAAAIGIPLGARNEVLTVLSGVLPVHELAQRIANADTAVILKVGRNLERVRDAVTKAGCLDRAYYVERATMDGERVAPLAEVGVDGAPYFSMVVVPSMLAFRR